MKRQSPFKFLYAYFKDYKLLILVSVLFGALGSAAYYTVLKGMEDFINAAIDQRDWDKIQYLSFGIFGVFFAVALTDYFHKTSIRIVLERVINSLRINIFNKFLIFSTKTLSKYPTGKAASHLLSDVLIVGHSRDIISQLIKQPFNLIAFLTVMLTISWKLFLVCIVVVVPLALLTGLLGKTAKKYQHRLQDSLENISQDTIEGIAGIKTAHSFGVTHSIFSKFKATCTKAYKSLVSLTLLEEATGSATMIIFGAAGAIIIGYGAHLIIETGELTIAEFMPFFVAAFAMIEPIKVLSKINVKIQELSAATERIQGIFDEELDSLSISQETSFNNSNKDYSKRESSISVAFKNVSFRYPSSLIDKRSNLALTNIDLNIEPGQKVALVGASGSGKSTLSLLAMRFLDPISGQITYNNIDSKDWDVAHLRRQFSYVSQDVFMFKNTIKENLLIAKPDAHDDELWLALEKAQIKSFVESLPQKLETVFSEKATNISGGEKQRFALARAFLKDAPFIILDEATSNLDSKNERLIQQAIDNLDGNLSMLVIAHRLSTIKNVDKVFVFETGKIIEQGAPDVLFNKHSGAFAQLLNDQSSELKS